VDVHMGYACIPFFWRQLGPPRLLFISPPKPSVTILPIWTRAFVNHRNRNGRTTSSTRIR
jgi:hypothetical protein